MRDKWYITLWSLIGWLVTRFILPIVTVATPFVVAFGLLHPNPGAITALRLHSNEVALLAGIGGSRICPSRTENACTSISRHLYIVLPQFSFATVTQKSLGVEVDSMPGGGLIILFIWLIGAWCAWHYWFKPVTSNYSLKRDRQKAAAP